MDADPVVMRALEQLVEEIKIKAERLYAAFIRWIFGVAQDILNEHYAPVLSWNLASKDNVFSASP